MTTLNVVGVKFVAIVQTTVVLLILIVGFFFVSGAGVTGSVSNLEPLFAEGATGITIVLVMVLFMFVGFDIIHAAEEIDLPHRDIGNGSNSVRDDGHCLVYADHHCGAGHEQ